ncbi:serine--tRNA ligase [Saccharolobus islandicus]|jgi:seryl-tRNA synthetase|uniref:Serine--tRNA ligase n=5 Tax=Saccharolobus islandicus TaxID=43080 RepID=SYS_SACI1|nr:serine--tRNA ligase [Sulfolobus islandicus]C3MQH9.1 RecName: Full=Serine--tRNA ligase; AltName: Full=Seryl-tRNA synthetase; Short=SerRS; AltName: Full=Seryl-tRNA(Ser/Sec) synthetase [Sulfolobus islandicus L.S.2.15]C3N6A0.1 RecName: Full=Serine--tRNA ligase; AltName: Full=Seryl-tRNA synthetase; Short=SerRS; AltName: Full=Seryl-tRNA(Ser/Sec) synthetase [Sulfolobus islandicus M.16.27]C3NGY7.1 RecName: Full=Serine--tRNA ligase; AltName: Full=Seryl-tRNA synthetase; Short=SerRS; AltName: Full=Seryl
MSWSILEFLRKNPEELKNNLKRRAIDVSLVDKAVELDKKWRQVLQEVERLRHQHNVLSSQIPKLSGEERKKKIEESKNLLKILEDKEKELEKIEVERDRLLSSLPNLVADDVPNGPDDSYNIPIKFWGKFKVYEGDVEEFLRQTKDANVNYEIIKWKPKGHAEMLEDVLHLGNTLKAAEIAGSRFYYLFNDIVWLDFALLLFAIDYITQQGYTLVLPPYMLRGEVIQSVIDLDTFKDAIYKIENEDLYLIATAEHSIAAMFFKEEIEKDKLPLKFAGISPAFRKEAGAANKDLKGIFRVHQFHKVEQFIFSTPEDSWKYHAELITNAESIFQQLELPYRIVNIASGDLGACAAKKFDLEVWMPAQAKFREMVSCSNCTDWQAFRMKIRYVDRKNNKRGYVHTLNSTAIASTRTITAILENYQREDGVVEVPKVLRKYLEIFPKAPKDYIYPLKNKII